MKIVAIVLAILFFALAVGYYTGAVQFGAHKPGPHHTHAFVLAVLGVLSLVWLRFQSAGPVARTR